jgi:hypothetical protein
VVSIIPLLVALLAQPARIPASAGSGDGESAGQGQIAYCGDGYADLVVGVPFENIGSKTDAGGVNVIYGSELGLSSAGNRFWDQDQSDVEGTADPSDCFGYALIGGDFNGDGYADLAVAVPYEDIGSALFAGQVHIFYGRDDGLYAPAWWQVWHQDSTDIGGTAEELDAFGYALAALPAAATGDMEYTVYLPYVLREQ